MDPVTLGLVSMGVGGAIKALGGLFGDNTADLMRQQAQLKLSTLEENMRRTEGQQTQVLSSTKARMAGTGFSEDSGSFSGYIKTMASEFELQNKAAETNARKSVDLMMQGADQADMAKWLNVGTGLAGAGLSAAGLFA